MATTRLPWVAARHEYNPMFAPMSIQADALCRYLRKRSISFFSKLPDAIDLLPANLNPNGVGRAGAKAARSSRNDLYACPTLGIQESTARFATERIVDMDLIDPQYA